MRILLVHHTYPPEGLAGSETYTEALARQLALRHEVSVLHASADPSREDHAVVETTRGAVRVFSLNNCHRDVPGFEAYRDPLAARAAARVLDAVRPELVHVGHLSGLSTGLVHEARLRGAPVVLTLHDFWTVCPLGQLFTVRGAVCPGPEPRRCLDCVGSQVAPGAGAARTLAPRLPIAAGLGRLVAQLGHSGADRVARRLEEMKQVLLSADLVLSPSRFLRDRMAALGIEGIEVLPYGHESVEPTRVPDASGRVRFGFVGAAIPSKGLHVLCEAFVRLADPRAALRIHGPFVPYHGDTSYEARVRRVLGHHADGALRGAFPHARLGEVLGAIDVLVVPSLWEENAPLVVSEAFASRLPVVASDHGGLREMVRDGEDGLLFRPGDADALAAAMRRLLDEPELRSRLGTQPPPVPAMAEHVRSLEDLYARAQRRYAARAGRVGVVIVDKSQGEAAAAAARSAMDASLRPAIVVVENGPGPEPPVPEGVDVLRLPENRGYAGGINAGVAHLLAKGCDRLLLLNNDATLEPGCLRRLAEALEDETLAAVGPVVLRAADGRIESRGARFDARWGRQRLSGFGERLEPREGRLAVTSLTGAALMASAAALRRVGVLDEDYFHSFEDTDWSLRARAAGFGLAVVLGAVVRHAGGRTLGSESPERLYYAARNHVRAAERLLPLEGAQRWLRRLSILALNVAHAVRQREVPRRAGVRAVLLGTSDSWRGRFGPRTP